jgi:hypothetical protein
MQMMFMHNFPLTVDLAQSDCQLELQLDFFPFRLGSGATHQGSNKRYSSASR